MYNAKMRSTTAELKNFMLADSAENMAFERNMLDGYQRISDSVIIGESPNKGRGQNIKVYFDILIKIFNKQFKSTLNQTENAYECITLQVKGEDGKWRWTWSERSVPVNHKPYLTAGIYINAEGPTHIHDVKFRNFAGDTVNTEYCGIAFKDNFDMGMGASSSVKGKMQAEVSILSTCFQQVNNFEP